MGPALVVQIPPNCKGVGLVNRLDRTLKRAELPQVITAHLTMQGREVDNELGCRASRLKRGIPLHGIMPLDAHYGIKHILSHFVFYNI